MRTLLVVTLILLLGCGAQASDREELEEIVIPPEIEIPTVEHTEVALRVSVWDDTEARPLRGRTEVWLRGAGSWFPDVRYGSDVRTFPERRLGTVDTLMFYPMGRDGPEVVVPVFVTQGLCPLGCVRDMVNIEVSDAAYEVWGPVAGGRTRITR